MRSDNVIEQLSTFKDVTYFDESHTYYIGNKRLISGTQFAGKVVPEFPKQEASKNKAEKLNIPQEQLLQEWKIEGKFSKIKGTHVHDYIEDFYKNKIKKTRSDLISEDEEIDSNLLSEKYYKCVEQFHNFYNDTHQFLLPICSELVIGDKDYLVGGTIDQLFYSFKTEKYHLFDWKTNKKINHTNSFSNLKPPVSHLQKTEYNKYCLQLSIYKKVLEKNTDIPIGDSFLIHFTEHNTNYEVHKCKDLTDECELILKQINTNNGKNLQY
jgi:ATP-dependent exoDNAse (exonuclease V) beta subunit